MRSLFSSAYVFMLFLVERLSLIHTFIYEHKDLKIQCKVVIYSPLNHFLASVHWLNITAILNSWHRKIQKGS